MALPDMRNHVHRNGFDLSCKIAFTGNVGELLPFYVREVLPGDKFYFGKDSQHFTRTSPVNTAAYSRFREHFDYYFVPYRLLWDKFPQWIIQTKDPQYAASASASAGVFDNCPYITDRGLFNYYYAVNNYSGSQLIDILGYDFFTKSLKLAQLLGYGSIIDSWDSLSDSNRPTSGLAISPFRFAAYQKIYRDFYRNSQWEESAPYTFNFDYVLTSGQTYLDDTIFMQTPNAPRTVNSMFELHYANWQKDYFTGILPNSQFGSVAVAGPVLGNLGFDVGTVSGADNFLVARNGVGTAAAAVGKSLSSGAPTQYFSLSSEAINTSGISVLQIRIAEALQKWSEITQSGQKGYKDQLEKHWSVKVSDYASDRCRWIGGHSSSLTIEAVTNTNLTGNNDADLAGRGVGAAEHDGFEFEVPDGEYGIIMGIYHASPLLDYDINCGLDREITKVKATDFAIPEFDSIGMQSQHLSDIYYDALNRTASIGYVPRYAEYKTARDMCAGGLQQSSFNSSAGYRNWTNSLSREYIRNIIFGANGSTPNWMGYRSFKINPSLCNPIFVAQQTAGPDPEFSSDQLLINKYNDVKVVRNLSESGMPY